MGAYGMYYRKRLMIETRAVDICVYVYVGMCILLCVFPYACTRMCTCMYRIGICARVIWSICAIVWVPVCTCVHDLVSLYNRAFCRCHKHRYLGTEYRALITTHYV